MKKLLTLITLFVFFLQAVPLVNFFTGKTILVTLVEEDKTPEVKLKAKKDIKEFIDFLATVPSKVNITYCGNGLYIKTLPCVYLEYFTPPPNHC